jgi:Recombination endonuclease VII
MIDEPSRAWVHSRWVSATGGISIVAECSMTLCFTCRINSRYRNSSYCRSCLNARQRDYIKRNHEKVRLSKHNYSISERYKSKRKLRYHGLSWESKQEWQRRNFKNRIWHDFSMTVQDYANLWLKQNFSCAICGIITHDLDLDHNHKSGHHRGLLCTLCNTRLAILEDFVYVLKARQYLLRWKLSDPQPMPVESAETLS